MTAECWLKKERMDVGCAGPGREQCFADGDELVGRASTVALIATVHLSSEKISGTVLNDCIYTIALLE